MAPIRLFGLSRAGMLVIAGGIVLLGGLLATHLWMVASAERRDRRVVAAIDQVMAEADQHFGVGSLEREPSRDLQASLGQVVSELDAFAGRVEATEKRFNDDGGVTLPRLKSKSDIDRRADLADQMLGLSRAFIAYGDWLFGHLRQQVGPIEASQGRGDLIEPLERQYRWAYHRHVREAEMKVFAAEREVLDFLHDHWGEWSYDSKTNSAVFTNQQLQKHLDALEDQRHAAVAERDNFLGDEAMKKWEAENKPGG